MKTSNDWHRHNTTIIIHNKMDPHVLFRIFNTQVFLWCVIGLDSHIWFTKLFTISYYIVNAICDKTLCELERDNRTYKCCIRFVVNMIMATCAVYYFDQFRNYYLNMTYRNLLVTSFVGCLFWFLKELVWGVDVNESKYKKVELFASAIFVYWYVMYD